MSRPSTTPALLCLMAMCIGCVPAQPRPAPPAPVTETPVAQPLPAPPVPPAPPVVEEAAQAVPPQQRQVSDAERLLYYYEYVSKLPAGQVAQEADRAQKFYTQHRSEFTLMQLALVRSLPATPAKERTQAFELLGPYLKDSRPGNSKLRPLGLLLSSMLTEQQRLEAEIQQQAVKLKEEARRNEELKQKLDALIETERKILERNKPTRTQ